VAAAKPKTFGRTYFYGLVVLPYVGWSLGTLLGAAAGNILPLMVTNALGIALYAMFIAIIIPPSIKEKGVSCAVALGAGVSTILYLIDFFKEIPSGLLVIISALITDSLVALIFPIKDNKEVD
jgi:predicted branched-subunit amino acid permease